MSYPRVNSKSIELFDCRVDNDGQVAAASVLAEGQLTAGPHVTALESAISSRLSGREAVAIANMTQALEIALKLAGVGPGDEVLTLAFNCLKTNSAIHNVGARPVWVDLDPDTATMNVEDARTQITAKTKALVLYHVGGYPSDAFALRLLCDETGIAFIEDANAAFLAQLPGGALAGTLADFAVFSLYANRLINAVEGAMLICARPADAKRARRLRHLGIDQRGFRDAQGEINPASDVAEIGVSATMNNVNAAIALTSLETVDTRLNIVRRNAKRMSEAIASMSSLRAVLPLRDSEPAFWVFMLLADDQNALLDRLSALGIGKTKLHQPNQVYSGFGASTRSLPGTDSLATRLVGLPVGWWIGEDHIDYILAGLDAYAAR